ncbi:hypothetical protein BDY19DRAFT_909865 [Irpex rosettiformis]|uniref:Uncharacterized protein n=1 Tax=Irpex rosettiformis TaxID=378272 RepID=A0ACB8TQV0_9APHY|nr:hypothetical protein BDY19DRAFT_909865 [Irpex rosettiformis]
MSNVTSTTLTPHLLNAAPESSSNIVPYTIAAFGTLLVYDYLCTLADEVSLVWLQPWNIGTILFLLNRYPPFVDTFLSLRGKMLIVLSTPSAIDCGRFTRLSVALTTVQYPEVCLRNFKTVTWLIVSGVFVAEMILMIRTYAIFQRKRWIRIFLCILMAIVLVAGCVVVELELESLHFIVGLTAFKAVQHLRRSRSPLVINLYRNGLLFYIYILLISLANVIVPVVGSSELANWLATIFCTRVLLSLLHERRQLVSSLADSNTHMTAFEKFTTLLPPSDGSSEDVVSTPRGSSDWPGGMVEPGDVEMDDLCNYGENPGSPGS